LSNCESSNREASNRESSIGEPPNGLGVVLFQSVQGAIGAEKLLAEAGFEHKLIPVPRSLSSNCGFCVRFTWTDRDLVEKLLAGTDLGVVEITAL
jgi:hypothetical protein